MNEQLITFETAKLAKLKGFDKFNEACETGYHPDTGAVLGKPFWDRFCNDKRSVGRPSQSLLQKWLREVHKIDVIASPIDDKYECRIISNRVKGTHIDTPFDYCTSPWLYGTYEEALEKGLQEALNLLQT